MAILQPQMVGESDVDVDTLIVFATNRGPGVAWDAVNGALWGCNGTAHVIVVDDSGEIVTGHHPDKVTVIRSSLLSRKELSGFKTNEGIKYAVEQGMQFKQVLVLDDDALMIRPGFDQWALETMKFGSIDLLGVEDRVNYQDRWSLGYDFFEKAKVPELLSGFYPNPGTIFYAINMMSRALVDTLYKRQLLVPLGYETWPLWPDVYISWVTNMLGHVVTCWGHMDRPKAPMFADHPNHQRSGGPEPRILAAEFLVFHSTKAVRGYSELELRQHYQMVRAQSGWEPLGPPSGVLPAVMR
jgi:hypothetical protein